MEFSIKKSRLHYERYIKYNKRDNAGPDCIEEIRKGHQNGVDHLQT
jgi:hypothetical protein